MVNVAGSSNEISGLFRRKKDRGKNGAKMTEPSLETEGFVTINGTPSHIVTYGKWIEDNLDDMHSVIFILPGNPGIANYYKSFMKTLHDQTGGISVWAVSHAGHKRPPTGVAFPEFRQLYSLEEQIQQKINFMEHYIPERVQIYLIGHSIGSKIAMEIIKRKSSSYNIAKSYMLCPTVEWIRETPNGRKMVTLLKYFRWLIYILAYIVSIFPKCLKLSTVKWHFGSRQVSEECITSSVELIDSFILNNITYMAHTEFEAVTDLDVELLQEHERKFLFFYVPNDNWCPLKFHEHLITAVPNIQALVSEDNYDHAFVLEYSENFAVMVAQWINNTTQLQDC